LTRRAHITEQKNLDAEASVLGAILLENAALSRINGLQAEDFYDPRHRVVFGAMRDLERAGRPIDTVTLEEQLEQENHLQAIGGLPFLSDLVRVVPTADNAAEYADIVHKLALGRAIRLRAAEIAASDADLDDLLSKAGAYGEWVGRVATPPPPPLRGYGLSMVDLLHEEDDEDDILDWRLRGFVPSDGPSIIVGEPKSMKTWIEEHQAVSVAAFLPSWLGNSEFGIRGGRVLILAMEDHVKVTRRRIRRLAWGMGINPLELENLRVEPNLAPFRFDQPKDLDRLRRTFDAWRPDLVYVDSLTKTHHRDENSVKEMGPVLEAWEGLCRDYSCAVTALHHMNKPSQTNTRGRLGNRMRGSTAIFAFVRYLTFVTKVDDEHSSVEVDGNMLFRPAPFNIEITDGVSPNGKSITTLTYVGPKVETASAELLDQVITALIEGPATSGEISKAIKKQKNRVLIALRALQHDRKVRFEDRQWRLSL
jgi:replicative DNA helicase